MKNFLQKMIDEEIARDNIVGTSIMIAKNGKIIFESHSGLADREAEKKVNAKTIFRFSSLTKPIVTAAALALVEKGKLDLDLPITTWLPNFQPKLKSGVIANITLRHLLNHTSGLTYGFLSEDNEPYHSAGVSDGLDEAVLSLEENLNRLALVPLMFEPGTNWCYSVSTDVVGAILEKCCNMPLPEIIKRYVTEPLGMHDTVFYIQDSDRLAKAYADKGKKDEQTRLMQKKDKVLLPGCGFIHYAPGRITNPQAYPSGGGGMAGTSKDYLKFLEAIRQGGEQILSRASVALMTQDCVENFDVPAAGPGYGFGMGFAVVRNSEEAGTPRQKGSFEWGGVYGCKMFVDPTADISVVILTNTALDGLLNFPVKITQAIYDGLKLQDDFQYVRPQSAEDSLISSISHFTVKQEPPKVFFDVDAEEISNNSDKPCLS
ncbi:MAG: beta-lactamase family protein [Legionellales bacterium]|nr:beta-lactamase family protein [Legionellales bacterium]